MKVAVIASRANQDVREIVIETIGKDHEVLVPEGRFRNGEWIEQFEPSAMGLPWWSTEDVTEVGHALAHYASLSADVVARPFRLIGEADFVLLVRPCGKQCYAELGFALGLRKPTAVFMYWDDNAEGIPVPALYRPEVIDAAVGVRTPKFQEILNVLQAWSEAKEKENAEVGPTESEDTRGNDSGGGSATAEGSAADAEQSNSGPKPPGE